MSFVRLSVHSTPLVRSKKGFGGKALRASDLGARPQNKSNLAKCLSHLQPLMRLEPADDERGTPFGGSEGRWKKQYIQTDGTNPLFVEPFGIMKRAWQGLITSNMK
ncbi:hypothetical protein SK128_021758 [Halocaridina rubra]|uniref:Uncharacterized protein n=1 Tax=Halocaridina rubra TaxID=373956 RepID=A0AAN8ZXA2_HALRR